MQRSKLRWAALAACALWTVAGGGWLSTAGPPAGGLPAGGLPAGGLSGTAAVAWAAPDAVDDARLKSLEALEAITRALEDVARKAREEARQATESAREQVRSSLEKACDTALRACQKVCGEDEKCLRACREGRKQCQS